MPEGPECKILAEELSEFLSGSFLTDVKCSLSGRYRNGELEKMFNEGMIQSHLNSKSMYANETLKGKMLLGVKSVGKLICFIFEDDLFILATLGMTGGFSMQSNPYTAVTMNFKFIDQDKPVYFNDKRHFGTIVMCDLLYFRNKISQIGMDIFDPNFSPAYVIERMNKSKSTVNICVWLMDQRNCAGVGNYIKSEVLHLSNIKPMERVGDLTQDRIVLLTKAIVKIATDSYNLGGLSMRDFTHLDGSSGDFLSFTKVYGKKVDEFGGEVKKVKTPDGRTTWYV